VLPFPIKKSLQDGVFPGNEKGFTLVEMLVAICISALMLGVLSEFLYSWTGIWVKNSRLYQKEQQLKIIYQTMDNNLKQLYPGAYLPDVAFQGDEDQFGFWQETKEGLIQVCYRYDAEKKSVFRSFGFWGSKPEAAALFTGITEWKLEYYHPTERNWLLNWEHQSFKKELVPALIRVSIQTKLTNRVTLTFPIKAWHQEVDPNEDEAE
jgi:prepilin-type N-terminal cleavage/methylation domain-containing protein